MKTRNGRTPPLRLRRSALNTICRELWCIGEKFFYREWRGHAKTVPGQRGVGVIEEQSVVQFGESFTELHLHRHGKKLSCRIGPRAGRKEKRHPDSRPRNARGWGKCRIMPREAFVPSPRRISAWVARSPRPRASVRTAEKRRRATTCISEMTPKRTT